MHQLSVLFSIQVICNDDSSKLNLSAKFKNLLSKTFAGSRRIDTATNVDNENPPVRDDELDHNHDEPVNEDTSIQCDSCDAFGIDSTNMSGESACEICTEEVEQQHETEVAPIVSKIRNPLKVVESFVAEVQTPGNFELKEEPKPKPVKSAPPRLQPEISDNRILEPSRCGPCSRRPSNVCPYAIQRPATAEQPKCRPPPRRNCTPNSQQTSNDNSKNLWKWW